MKDMKICKIIKDLLPNYLEKLTSEQTNRWIENHLIECKNCQNTLKHMQQEIDIPQTQVEEVDYLKKFHKKIGRAFAWGIGIGLMLLLIVYLSVAGYRWYILSSITSKLQSYKQVSNVYMEIEEVLFKNRSFYNHTKTKIWYKDKMLRYEREDALVPMNQNFIGMIDIANKKQYVINTEEKTVKVQDIQKDTIEWEDILSYFVGERGYVDEKTNVLKACNLYEPVIYAKEKEWVVNEYTYSKDTGLLESRFFDNVYGDAHTHYAHYTTYHYDFDKVTKEEVVFPDVSKYTKIE